MTGGPGGLFWFYVASMALGFYDIWRKGPYVPRARHSSRAVAAPEAPKPPPPDALMKAKLAEYMRLASTLEYHRVPHLSRPPSGERLVLSMPVFLYESSENRLRRNRSVTARHLMRDLVAAHPTGAASRESVVLVDRGTLMVTHRRIVFKSPRRLREFPLNELSFFSTTWSSIALAARWRYGISYFRGIGATRIKFKVEGEGDSGEARDYSFNITGPDIREIVNILQAAPILSRQ